MKNMKKVLSVFLAGTMVVTPFTALAVEKNNEVVIMPEEIKGEYVTFNGVIKSVNQNDERMSILVDDLDNKGNQLVFHISDDVKIFGTKPTRENKKMRLVEGAEVSVFYPINTPVALSLPGQLTPEVIVVKEEGTNVGVKVDKFDENLLSSDGTLKLKVEDEKEYQNKTLLVYYEVVGLSFPAQTTPTLIVVLDEGKDTNVVDENQGSQKVEGEGKIVVLDKIKFEDKAYKADMYRKSPDVVMISLRDIANIMDYEIKWQGKEKPIEMTKGAFFTSIELGKNNYFFNKVAPFRLESEPEFKGSKTYVPIGFIEKVLQKDVKVVDGLLEVK